MNQPTTTDTAKNAKLAKNANGGAPIMKGNADVPEGFREVRTSYPHWKPDGCEAFPVQGILLDRVQMPDATELDKKTGEVKIKKWAILVIRATKATKAFSEEGNDELIDVEVGQDLGVPVSYDLTSLANVARDPHFVYEVFIKAGKVTKLSGGREMRNYTKAIKPESKMSRASTGYFLTPGIQAAVEAGGAPDSAIPF